MAAAPSSLGTHFAEELSCSICLELFTRPKVLPCGHTFCQDCLQNLAGRGWTFKCSICRRKVRVPSQGVADFPDSHIIASMCETLQQQTSQSGGTCEQHQSGDRCSSHPSEVLKLYCKHCHIPICTQCLEEAHDDHLTTTIKKAAQEKSSTVQALVNEGRDIVESYLSFLRSLREEEKALNEKKQQRDDSIIQAYNQTVQKLTERKDHLLSQSTQNHTKNLDRIQTERDRVLADVSELSAACDRAEQELQQEWIDFLSQQTDLTEVVGKYRRKAAPTPVQTQSAVFQPTQTPVPVLGHVTVQSLPSAPIPAAPAARGTGHHHGNQRQSIQTYPSAPIPASPAARGTGHHHGNRRQREQQPQRVTLHGFESQRGVQLLNPDNLFDESDPFGVTVSGTFGHERVFVTEYKNHRVQVCTRQGNPVSQFPTVVSGEQKMKPHDVTRDKEDNLWVVGNTDSTDIVVQYDNKGTVLGKFDLQKTGWARGVAVDTRRNHILVTQTTGDRDNRQCEVQVFRPDGTLVRTVGQQQGMKYPLYIAVDGDGNILVSDCENHCVYVYNEDGQFLFQIGGKGLSNGQLKHPQGICIDGQGNIIVADYGNRRVEKFDTTGKFLSHRAAKLKSPYPRAIAMTSHGQLGVTKKISENMERSTCISRFSLY